jgi:hypothetical protein
VHSARAEALLHNVTAQSTAAVATDGYPALWGIAWSRPFWEFRALGESNLEQPP